MNKFLNRILPDNDRYRKCIAVGVSVIIAGLLSLWVIYGVRDYGIAIFILIPLFIGAIATMIYGSKRAITKTDAFLIGFTSLLVYTLGLLVFAIEGLLCIAMAAPIGLLLTWIGTIIGYFIIRKKPDNATSTMIILLLIIPTMSFIEKDQQPSLEAVVTSIEIEADIATVWNNVVEFPKLDQPTEFIFKIGIAYPINAKIEGTGKGAVRHCNFTTGSFVEPITVWDKPHLLKFDVLEQPAPLKEISFWDIDAPHLHDYFVSKEGQFKLTQLPNGNTLLEGTTWYYHNIRPEIYWRVWSNYIIHKIHNRVLTHIKNKSEGEH
jgi:hypothetical protein